MKIHQFLMRLLAPRCEKGREEFRHELARASAEAEDLTRTIQMSPEKIETLFKQIRLP